MTARRRSPLVRNTRLAPGFSIADGGVHFGVYAPHADKVELCTFDESGERETERHELPDCDNGLWHGFLHDAGSGLRYGYRVHGSYDPASGLRHNHHKLLLDPYAVQLHGDLRWSDALYGYRVGAAKGDLTLDRNDSAPFMPKAVVAQSTFDWGDDRRPQTPWTDTLIYEAHVRGLTQRLPGLPEQQRGTFAGLANDAVIDHLRRIGVTAVELLPIHAFARDRNLIEAGLTNYWGYNTLSFFSPDRAYLSGGDADEMRAAIKKLHAAGLEVILDVVYNHTCEGNELGATLSWRGFANADYYRLMPDDARHYINDTGCGNTVNLSSPIALRMVMDSLRWWAQEYHVDGFRFDLGVTLGREPTGFDPGCGFFDALLQDPVLSQLKLISEPWDIGPGGYQIGNHPPGFSEWNGKFRDDVRKFCRGDAAQRGPLAARLMGSAEMFDHHRRKPSASINFVTAHDGYTLEDLVSYEKKHNQANNENNRDGADHNESCNWGVEGPTEDAAIRSLRATIKRSLLTALMCSHGVPMLLAGDEFGQTQSGNNNGYCQDNELTWLDWARRDTPEGKSLVDFVSQLATLRKRLLTLQGHYFYHESVQPLPDIPDLYWFDERGEPMTQDDWNNGNGRLLGVRRACTLPNGSVERTIVLLNADAADHEFVLPKDGAHYARLIDTHLDHQDETAIEGSYLLAGRSIALLAATP